MSISEKQLAANRANAKKSTGPKTPGGKHNSSRNALTHGLLSKSILVPGESEDRFLELLRQHINEWQPATPTAYAYVETAVVCLWRLRRGWQFQTASLAHEQRALAETNSHEDPPTQGMLALRELDQPPRSQEALTRCETRIDRTYNRAINALIRLRAFAHQEWVRNEEMRKRSHQVEENTGIHAVGKAKRTVSEASTKPDRTPIEARPKAKKPNPLSPTGTGL
jgi:hypothetical protein